jgi:hypothetical protein
MVPSLGDRPKLRHLQTHARRDQLFHQGLDGQIRRDSIWNDFKAARELVFVGRRAGGSPHPVTSPIAPSSDRRAKLFAGGGKNSCAPARFTQIVILPNTHVPVVVCRSAGIWTRGQLTVLGRPAAGGEPANPAQRGTRLEATTDRAFLVSAGPPKVGAQRGLSILPGVRTGHLLVQTMALIA